MSKHGKNGNGNITPIKTDEGFTLTSAQKGELQLLEKTVLDAKCALSDASIQKLMVEQETANRANAVVAAQKAYTDRVHAMAREFGLDPNDPAKGLWDFNADHGKFTQRTSS